MLKKLFIAAAVLLTLFAAFVIYIMFNYEKVERGYQRSADLIRIQDIVYWTNLIEEYEAVTGHFPFQEEHFDTDRIGLVRIASEQQQQYFDPTSDLYNPKFDNNATGFFTEKPVAALLSELELVLGRKVEPHYDFQKVPTSSPIGYFYFVTNDGYIIWVTCISCGVTKISTLLMDGHTPTVNIGSVGMVPKVTKAQTREDMLENPQFQRWLNGNFAAP